MFVTIKFVTNLFVRNLLDKLSVRRDRT